MCALVRSSRQAAASACCEGLQLLSTLPALTQGCTPRLPTAPPAPPLPVALFFSLNFPLLLVWFYVFREDRRST